jgi:hypothetical protein
MIQFKISIYKFINNLVHVMMSHSLCINLYTVRVISNICTYYNLKKKITHL